MIAAVGLIASLAFAANHAFSVEQGGVVGCNPPRFMLVSEVDLEQQTLTGLSTFERQGPTPTFFGYNRKVKLADIKVTTARGERIGGDALKKLEGELVVITEGKPLCGAFLRLFREGTLVVTIEAKEEKKAEPSD